MECTSCGADLEPDSKFCIRCAAAVPGAAARDEDEHDHHEYEHDEGDVHTPSAAAPTSTSGQGAKVVGVFFALAMIILGAVRLANRPTVRFEVIEPPDLGYGAAGAAEARVVVPRGEPAQRPPTDSERALAGTWVATVGFDAPRPASTGSTLVQMQALRSGLSAPTERCVWLELYDNLRGFQHECGVIDTQPSVLERTDPLTGHRSPLGVAFRWAYEDGRLSITYDEEMVVTAAGQLTRFVETVLTLPQGSPPFDVQQSFPAHPDVPPLAHRFDVFAGSYLGDEPPGE